MYVYFLVCFSQFSDIRIIIISTFSRTEKHSISATSLKPHSSLNQTPPPTWYGLWVSPPPPPPPPPCKNCLEMENWSFGFFRNSRKISFSDRFSCYNAKWHPSRTGFFYFSFKNGSLRACPQAEKLAIKVEVSAKPPENWATSPAPPPRAVPPPTPGGTATSSPVYQWPFRPHEAAPPSEEPSASPSETMVPEKSGGIPFINSNPAVPLPTGEVDSATIRPVPTISGHGGLLQALDIFIYFSVFS